MKQCKRVEVGSAKAESVGQRSLPPPSNKSISVGLIRALESMLVLCLVGVKGSSKAQQLHASVCDHMNVQAAR